MWGQIYGYPNSASQQRVHYGTAAESDTANGESTGQQYRSWDSFNVNGWMTAADYLLWPPVANMKALHLLIHPSSTPPMVYDIRRCMPQLRGGGSVGATPQVALGMEVC